MYKRPRSRMEVAGVIVMLTLHTAVVWPASDVRPRDAVTDQRTVFELKVTDEAGGLVVISDTISETVRSLKLSVEDPTTGLVDLVAVHHSIASGVFELTVNSQIYIFDLSEPFSTCSPAVPVDEDTLIEVTRWIQSDDYRRLAALATRLSRAVQESPIAEREKVLTYLSLMTVFGFGVLPEDLHPYRIPADPLPGLRVHGELDIATSLFGAEAKGGFSNYSCYMNTPARDDCYTCCDRSAVFAGLICSPLGFPCAYGVAAGLWYCYVLCILANPYIP